MNCLYEGENMPVIVPDECIDRGVYDPDCPVDAIRLDRKPGIEKRLGIDAEYVKVGPNITVEGPPWTPRN